jgi:CHAT domain-containing protein/tetratricopeptide (TPR) repeat protein
VIAPTEAQATDPAIAAQARAWLAADLPPPRFGHQARALAWALKDLCYEAFSSNPPGAARAAQALHTLCEGDVPAEDRAEVQALADWTAGIGHLTQGQMAQAVASFDAAAAGLRVAGLPDPAAQTQVPKIMALSMLGQHEQAVACAEATQRELRALGNLGAAARVSQNLGSLQARRDNYPEAARHFRQAAVLFARLQDHEHSVLADIGLADAHTAMGHPDEALRIFARARMRASNQSLGLQIALIDESVALLELARGHYQPALAGLEAARRSYESLALPQHLAIAEKQLADIYLELRLLPEALALLDRAVALFAAQESPDEQAWALTQRGRAQARLKQSADISFASAGRLFAQQGNAVGTAAVALARAELALQSSAAQAAVALAWADAAAAGYAQAGQAQGSAGAQVLRAQALLRLGDVAVARGIFDATLARAQTHQFLQVQVRCLTGQGQCALALGDSAGAQVAFEAAIELFEDQRRALPGDEIRSAFLSDHLRPYEELLRLALHSGDAALTLLRLERFRARTLDERWEEPVQNSATAAVDDAKGAAQRERLNWLYRQVQRLHNEGTDSQTLNDEMRELEHALMEGARRQRLAAPAQQASAGLDWDLAALQAALQPGDALVEYGAVDDELFACVVTRQAVRLHRHLASCQAVTQAVAALRFQMETLCHGAAPVHRHLHTLQVRAQARLAHLQRLVWAPLAPGLAGIQRLLLVPQGPLNAVPFAALPLAAMPLAAMPLAARPFSAPPFAASATDTVQSEGGALGQHFQIATVPSARAALRGLLRQPLPARRLLALGDSTRLPHTQSEVQDVLKLFELAGAQGQARWGEQASVAQLRALADQADVLHLACHAQFRSDNPRFSALHLADAALTVEQAEGLALPAGTVVLSACETGMADLASGDEQVGLVRAFLVAGASRVLASLWPVDDEVTSRFMAAFYGALVRGQNHACALQTAQAALRLLHPHPFFWAAFCLHGGW